MKLGELKQGDTLSYGGFCRLPAGSWSASSRLRHRASGSVTAALTVTLGTANAAGDTPIAVGTQVDSSAWEVGSHELDIRFVDAAGTVIHSPTVLLNVMPSVTPAP
jgi:hypothetical protein